MVGTPSTEPGRNTRIDPYAKTDIRRVDQTAADRAARERAADEAEHRQLAAEHGRVGGWPETGRPEQLGRTAEFAQQRHERRPEPGRKARASAMATLSLIFGMAAVLFVLTGLLAGWGLALGVLATLLGIGGLVGTRHRHVTGKGDALLGLILGVSAIVLGVVALSETVSWFTADSNLVQRARDWLDAQFVNRF